MARRTLEMLVMLALVALAAYPRPGFRFVGRWQLGEDCPVTVTPARFRLGDEDHLGESRMLGPLYGSWTASETRARTFRLQVAFCDGPLDSYEGEWLDADTFVLWVNGESYTLRRISFD